MASYFKGELSIENKIFNADLIIVGRLEKEVSSEHLQVENNQVQLVVFNLLVENILKGDLNHSDKIIHLRGIRTPNDEKNKYTYSKGIRQLFLLGKDHGIDSKLPQFTIYFNTVFEINEKDEIILPELDFKELTKKGWLNANFVKIDVFKAIIGKLMQREKVNSIPKNELQFAKKQTEIKSTNLFEEIYSDNGLLKESEVLQSKNKYK